MKKKNSNQKIKCNVSNCDHNVSDVECNLDEIKVTSNSDDTSTKKETICDSFECKENCNNCSEE